MAAQTKDKVVSDVVMWEVDQRFTRKQVTFTNNTGALASFVIGQMCEDTAGEYTPIAENQTDPIGILLENVDSLADAASVEVSMMVRGPALVNQDELVSPDTDADLTSQRAALEALNMIMVAEPTVVEEQTT